MKEEEEVKEEEEEEEEVKRASRTGSTVCTVLRVGLLVVKLVLFQ